MALTRLKNDEQKLEPDSEGLNELTELLERVRGVGGTSSAVGAIGDQRRLLRPPLFAARRQHRLARHPPPALKGLLPRPSPARRPPSRPLAA